MRKRFKSSKNEKYPKHQQCQIAGGFNFRLAIVVSIQNYGKEQEFEKPKMPSEAQRKEYI